LPFFLDLGLLTSWRCSWAWRSRVRDLFEQAKQNSPCHHLMDEIERRRTHRGAGLGGGPRRARADVTAVGDGRLRGQGNIIMSRHTRHPDPALLRPGARPPRSPSTGPTARGGESRAHARQAAGQDRSSTARGQTPGFTGATSPDQRGRAVAGRHGRREIGQDEARGGDHARDRRPRKTRADEREERKRSPPTTRWDTRSVSHFLRALDPVHKISVHLVRAGRSATRSRCPRKIAS